VSSNLNYWTTKATLPSSTFNSFAKIAVNTNTNTVLVNLARFTSSPSTTAPDFKVIRSTNGWDWTDVSAGLPAPSSVAYTTSLHSAGAKFYALGIGLNNLNNSLDGITWGLDVRLANVHWKCLADNGLGSIVLTGTDEITGVHYIATSSNGGLNWATAAFTAIFPVGTTFHATTHPSNSGLPSHPKVYYCRGKFYIVNFRTTLENTTRRFYFSSFDGLTWALGELASSIASNGTVLAIAPFGVMGIRALVTNSDTDLHLNPSQLVASPDGSLWTPALNCPYVFDVPAGNVNASPITLRQQVSNKQHWTELKNLDDLGNNVLIGQCSTSNYFDTVYSDQPRGMIAIL